MTKERGESLADIFAQEEERRLAEGRAEIAAERAAWDALTPEEKAAEEAKHEARAQAEHEKGVRLGWWDADGNPLPDADEDEDEDEAEGEDE